MAVRKIARMGNPILSKNAVAIDDPTNPEIVRLADDMKDTLIDVGGSGIAAPQVFESLRLVVYRVSPRLVAGAKENSDPWVVMINPEIEFLPGPEEAGWERCLSIPGLHGKVMRPQRISINYQTPTGEAVSHEAEGALAVLLQHECDHLDGVLYPMQMTDLSLLEFDAEPGNLARDIAAGQKIWPVLQKLVDDWPGRDQWMD